ncbi:hypothetical protein VTK26DRAFT_7914 [Humicola hyalothermophila]
MKSLKGEEESLGWLGGSGSLSLVRGGGPCTQYVHATRQVHDIEMQLRQRLLLPAETTFVRLGLPRLASEDTDQHELWRKRKKNKNIQHRAILSLNSSTVRLTPFCSVSAYPLDKTPVINIIFWVKKQEVPGPKNGHLFSSVSALHFKKTVKLAVPQHRKAWRHTSSQSNRTSLNSTRGRETGQPLTGK